MKKNALIIGSGIHGITIALQLSNDYNVIMIDSNSEILMGASNGTHNRIHLGYHYPRSKDTIIECKSGYDFFIDNYKDCLIFPDFFYIIEKNSFTSSEQYKKIMTEECLPCISEYPDSIFLNKENIEECFKVNEACFDILKMRDRLKKQIETAGIKQYMNFEIQSFNILDKELRLFSSLKEEVNIKDIDLIVNCTYTYSNNVLKIFGINNFTEYEFEQTEIAVVECDSDVPAMTVMDGPFISILPYGNHKNKFIVYDVDNSVRIRENGYLFEKKDLKNESNWEKIQKHGLKYYPFFKDLKYIQSIYSHRPIPINIDNDSRQTRIVKEEFEIDFYSIKEGKFISAPSIAEIFKNIIDNK
jgi:hypothetical protein